MHWLCLHFPQLPLDRCRHNGDEATPFAVYETGQRPWIVACNSGAQQRGIQTGMAVSAARTLTADLVLQPRDPRAEQQELERLAVWAYQFSSQLSLVAPDAMLLEVQGSFTLFGGVDALQRRIAESVDNLGYHTLLASAPTPTAALWLARAGHEIHLMNPHTLTTAVGQLSFQVMDVDTQTLKRLQGMGLRRIADVLHLPRAGLAQRFAPEFVLQLDRALGRAADPRAPFAPPMRFEERLVLPTEVQEVTALLFALRRLLFALCGWLLSQGKGVQRLQLSLLHRQRSATKLSISLLSPSRDHEHLLRVLRERLQKLELVAPVEELLLCAEELEVLDAENDDLFEHQVVGQLAWEPLVERLQARLGKQAVQGIAMVADHRPERAWRYCAPGQGAILPVQLPPRPAWLLPKPMSLVVKNGCPCFEGELQLTPDRERLEGGWWEGEDMARDYFVATNSRGARFWVYRELNASARWFLHGVFD